MTGIIDISLGRRCVNRCGTVEALKRMFTHVADEMAPTERELEQAICSDCTKVRGTLGRVRIGDLAAFRPAPKPKHVRESSPPKPLRNPKTPPRPAPTARVSGQKPQHARKPASKPVVGLKKLRAAGLQKARRDLQKKLEAPRMNEVENYAERLQAQKQLLELDRKIAVLNGNRRHAA